MRSAWVSRVTSPISAIDHLTTIRENTASATTSSKGEAWHRLPQPDLYEAIKEAEPLTPVLNYKYSANRWRHYERMSGLPGGFMILGDAVCSFNPVYGQGMTVAALEAKVLDAFLRQHPRGSSNQERGLAQRFQKAVAKVVEWPRQMATGADRPYVETQEEPGRLMRLLNWYMQRVMQLTNSNARVAD